MDVEPGDLRGVPQRPAPTPVHSDGHGRDDIRQRCLPPELLFRMGSDVSQDLGHDLRRIARHTAYVELDTLSEEALGRPDKVSDHAHLWSVKLVSSLSPHNDLCAVVADDRWMWTTP